jgi:P-type Cu2+ transporter
MIKEGLPENDNVHEMPSTGESHVGHSTGARETQDIGDMHNMGDMQDIGDIHHMDDMPDIHHMGDVHEMTGKEGRGMDGDDIAKAPENSKKAHHGRHEGHLTEDFKRRFIISLILTIPILILSPFIQETLGFELTFPNAGVLLFILSTFVYIYVTPERQHICR